VIEAALIWVGEDDEDVHETSEPAKRPIMRRDLLASQPPHTATSDDAR